MDSLLDPAAQGDFDARRYPYLVIRLAAGVLSVRLLPPELGRAQLVMSALQTMDRLKRRFRLLLVFDRGNALLIEPDGTISRSSPLPEEIVAAAIPDQHPATSRRGAARAAVVRRAQPRRIEQRLRNGEVRLTHNSVALLQGLVDRPRGTAASRHDFVRAAIPHVQRFRSPSYRTLYYAIARLPTTWVARKAIGNRVEFRLRPRGRAIIYGQVPAFIVGVGPYAPRQRGAAE
jgi:hypothetical protein